MIERMRSRSKRGERVDTIMRLDSNSRGKDDRMHGLCDGVDMGELDYEYIGVIENVRVETDEVARHEHHSLVEIQRFGVRARIGLKNLIPTIIISFNYTLY